MKLKTAGGCFRAVAALAEDPEFHFAQVLEPGTIEWIHNPSIMHSRSAVVDGEVRLFVSTSGRV